MGCAIAGGGVFIVVGVTLFVFGDEGTANVGLILIGIVFVLTVVGGLVWAVVGGVVEGVRSARSTRPSTLAPSGPPLRQSIPERVRHEVWRRDQGRCADCGSRERLEYDHIIPISRGGSNTARNIELRCETCNRRKGARV